MLLPSEKGGFWCSLSCFLNESTSTFVAYIHLILSSTTGKQQQHEDTTPASNQWKTFWRSMLFPWCLSSIFGQFHYICNKSMKIFFSPFFPFFSQSRLYKWFFSGNVSKYFNGSQSLEITNVYFQLKDLSSTILGSRLLLSFWE